MTLTLTDIIAIASIVIMASGAVTTLLMYFDKRKNTKLSEKGTDGNYTNNMTESIATLYKQVKEALKDKADAEIKHKEELVALREELRVDNETQRAENVQLHKKIAELEEQIRSIIFEIKLVGEMGSDPSIKTVTIKRISATAVTK
jgi:hypothetical protein